jgi:predicted RNA binding protein YcfA (HicA-like mRNA interferase family)
LGRLRRLSGRDVRAILERHGFVLVRQRGSHMIMQVRKADGGTVTVPVPDHRELRTGTLHGIIEQSGLPRSLFESPE